ncbi:DUF1697 domain-containing protein [Hoyosella subflava]|uniref:DUF1697 domain-containing protein n=1 Tax=Hoyosella subflava (strain DSM 45089 / JCM 17490 / NBRC 109087 / DQS3-9A1) TaxID=443218 RepID=F6EKT6_HOYSD|nr:DUF1697 domain-containing protein [Hoyosella subflava]AEF41416.1 hypothetical protein AS9A_2969 [Hoyosella subflava DQS3-9A1]
MGSRIHLVRAINVGGAKLPMAELRAIAAALGASDVRTYIASGNLLCEPPGDPDAFDRALEEAIQAQFGFFREVISRSPDEVQAALDAHPFAIVNPKFSYVTFLLREPAATAVEKARTYETGKDCWDVIGREMHIRYVDGAGRPEMKDASIGRALGVPGTARNINTVRKLLELSR